jgi:hypothetical protein
LTILPYSASVADMKPNNTVGLDSHALATLRYIRQSIDSANVVSLPGSAGYALGAIGLATAGLSFLPSLAAHWFVLWLCAAVPAFCVATCLLLRPGSIRELGLTPTPMRKFALCLLPCLFAGAVMTAVLWSQASIQPIRGLWLITYGCALLSASVLTTSALAVMGCGFVCLGVAGLFADTHIQAALMGIGFGGLHVLFAVLIGREARHARKA